MDIPKKSPRWLKLTALISVGLLVLVIIIIAASGGSDKKAGNNEEAKNQPIVSASPAQSKEEAQKELDEVISLAKKANLVSSYEFSDSATVVYSGDTWYTQTVAFKKDFIAKIAMLKKTITGYSHLEVRDAYSNEKVGEVTPLGSLEVYK